MLTDRMIINAYEALEKCCLAAADNRAEWETFSNLRDELAAFITQRGDLAERMQLKVK